MKSTSRWHSFSSAVNGVVYAFRTQPNTWIELFAAAVVVVAGILFSIDRLEWAIIAITVFSVLALEAVNSAIEALVDLVSPEYDELAGVVKDCAAGAMLLAATGAVFVAAAIFGPRLWALFVGV
ncbi:MAG: diacylglycerol kinase family protein [Chloroflexota bacterium]|nr:diacylglycerol kinase family protein [Chloroflexota bacterium]